MIRPPSACGTAPAALFASLSRGKEQQNSVVVYPNPHPGDDVGCNTMTPQGDRTTNFTRDSRTDDQAIGRASDAIRLRIPGVQPAPDPVDLRDFATLYPGIPAPKSGRFVTAGALEVISASAAGWWKNGTPPP